MGNGLGPRCWWYETPANRWLSESIDHRRRTVAVAASEKIFECLHRERPRRSIPSKFFFAGFSVIVTETQTPTASGYLWYKRARDVRKSKTPISYRLCGEDSAWMKSRERERDRPNRTNFATNWKNCLRLFLCKLYWIVFRLDLSLASSNIAWNINISLKFNSVL